MSAVTAGGHAGGGGDADRRRARAGGHQEGVGVAVVAARELDQLPPAGGGAGEAQRRHRRLGPRVDQAHHLDRRQRGGDPLAELDLGDGRGAEGGAAAERPLDGRDDRRMAVPEDVRAVAADVVEVAAAVLPLEPRPAAARTKTGVPPTPRKARTGELTPPGKHALGALEEVFARHSLHPARINRAASRAQ